MAERSSRILIIPPHSPTADEQPAHQQRGITLQQKASNQQDRGENHHAAQARQEPDRHQLAIDGFGGLLFEFDAMFVELFELRIDSNATA